jgi:hypothetical protein
MKQPYSIGIFISPKDPEAIKPEVYLYGADERATYDSDRKESLAEGWTFIGHWQPPVTEGNYHNRADHANGYWIDAYGDYRLTRDQSID